MSGNRTNKEEVRNFIQSRKETSIRQIMQYFEISRVAAYSHLVHLRDDGLIVASTGYYAKWTYIGEGQSTENQWRDKATKQADIIKELVEVTKANSGTLQAIINSGIMDGTTFGMNERICESEQVLKRAKE